MSYQAVLFDLDGVLAPTALIHRAAWRELFAGYFAAHGVTPGYTENDYFSNIDGRPRFSGVETELAAHGVTLPFGSASDTPEMETVCGLGNRKNALFLERLAEIRPYPEVPALLDALDELGVRKAVVTSSRNSAEVLARTGLAPRFELVVDGNVAAERGLKGKPAPDAYLLAAELLGVSPEHAIVAEDALSGVESGKAGGFFTVGVDRGEVGREALLKAGADVVVADLGELVEILRAPVRGGQRDAVSKPYDKSTTPTTLVSGASTVLPSSSSRASTVLPSSSSRASEALPSSSSRASEAQSRDLPPQTCAASNDGDPATARRMTNNGRRLTNDRRGVTSDERRPTNNNHQVPASLEATHD
jgi:HAD superfamily hydrolase (TIGR01509 family)